MPSYAHLWRRAQREAGVTADTKAPDRQTACSYWFRKSLSDQDTSQTIEQWQQALITVLQFSSTSFQMISPLELCRCFARLVCARHDMLVHHGMDLDKRRAQLKSLHDNTVRNRQALEQKKQAYHEARGTLQVTLQHYSSLRSSYLHDHSNDRRLRAVLESETAISIAPIQRL